MVREGDLARKGSRPGLSPAESSHYRRSRRRLHRPGTSPPTLDRSDTPGEPAEPGPVGPAAPSTERTWKFLFVRPRSASLVVSRERNDTKPIEAWTPGFARPADPRFGP